MKKINFEQLKQLGYEEGKELLLKSGYFIDDAAIERKEDYNIIDQYFTLYDEENTLLHTVSHVSYEKPVLNAAPELINEENWHWEEI